MVWKLYLLYRHSDIRITLEMDKTIAPTKLIIYLKPYSE